MERASHSTASHRSVISIHFFFLSSSFSYNALPFNLLFKVSLTDTVLHQKLWSCFSFRLNHFYQSAIGKSELKRRKKKKKNAVNYQTTLEHRLYVCGLCGCCVSSSLCTATHSQNWGSTLPAAHRTRCLCRAPSFTQHGRSFDSLTPWERRLTAFRWNSQTSCHLQSLFNTLTSSLSKKKKAQMES